jgi:hypothetical protein
MYGPSQEYFNQTFSPVYPALVEMIEDPSPNVRSACAYFLMRTIEHQETLVLSSEANFTTFINKILNHIQDHQRITGLLLKALTSLYEKCNQYKLESNLNPFF